VLRYFKLEEFDCTFTKKNEMNPEFLLLLDELRDLSNFPFVITSGYRDPSHPEEAKKEKPGTHSKGIACDIRVNSGAQKYIILQNAMKLKFTGIGIAKTFIHVDVRDTTPVIWTY
jgi:uncharacterized protein YcbK (DUF882 family)